MRLLTFVVCASQLVQCVGNDSVPTVDAGAPIAIGDLRNPDSGNRPDQGATVTIAGAVVTNIKAVGNSKLMFVQDPKSSSWAGVTLFVGAATPTLSTGDVVTATGTFTTYKGLEEIDVSAAGAYMKTGTASVPAPIDVAIADVANGGPRVMELQSMLVRIKNVTATAATASEQFPVVDITSPGPTTTVTSFYVNDTGASPFPANQGDKFASIAGNEVMNGVSGNQSMIAPGRASDVVPQ